MTNAFVKAGPAVGLGALANEAQKRIARVTRAFVPIVSSPGDSKMQIKSAAWKASAAPMSSPGDTWTHSPVFDFTRN